MDASAELSRGRESYAKHAWTDAYESLSNADAAGVLGAADLELLAGAAYMLGRDEENVRILERAHQSHLDAGDGLRAAGCAVWIGMHLATTGNLAPATGWFGRARRLVGREEGDCVERGYLLLPLAFQQEAGGDWEAAVASLVDAAAIAERFAERDLFALAVNHHGQILIEHGQVNEGLGLLDEAMVAVTTDELSPIVTGLVYCGVILACREAYELRRAQAWTAALSGWCGEQPDLVAFTGRCLLHRAEIMQHGGAWSEALEEARRAVERSERTGNERATGEAAYLQGEVHRLQGRLDAAEESYRAASRCGREPQPGLALLRLAQGSNEAATAAIRRAVEEANELPQRARLLPACVEIMLAVGDTESAQRACRELADIARAHPSEMLAAAAQHAQGTLDLAHGDAAGALVALRRSVQIWQELEAPYEAACGRVIVGIACRSLGDDDAMGMELEAAREAFAELGATPDLARVDALAHRGPAGDTHGLTQRELEVLRLVAAGETNKEIAAKLVVSERTVDRHVSNTFAKLGVSSRAAATAYAYEHDLL
ncbi:MAG TPA: LuxR C-terminal-related transcriptional regulator [Solirubrobacterales bacterium]